MSESETNQPESIEPVNPDLDGGESAELDGDESGDDATDDTDGE